MSLREIRDAVFYWMGVYTACGIAHNIIRIWGRPRRHYHKIIVRADNKGGGHNADN